MEKALIEDRWDIPKANVHIEGKIKQNKKKQNNLLKRNLPLEVGIKQ